MWDLRAVARSGGAVVRGRDTVARDACSFTDTSCVNGDTYDLVGMHADAQYNSWAIQYLLS
eukprot:2486824-Pleurochrysis_carterae.AAC.1